MEAVTRWHISNGLHGAARGRMPSVGARQGRDRRMAATHDFNVSGRHVVVLGAARSGIAAAELLARRGARVILSESRSAFDGMDRLRQLGITLELGGHTAQ